MTLTLVQDVLGKICESGCVWPLSSRDCRMGTLDGGAPWTYGDHEMQHTYQGMVLGPLFLPAYLAGMGYAFSQGQTGLGLLGPANFMEAGPYLPETSDTAPAPWP